MQRTDAERRLRQQQWIQLCVFVLIVIIGLLCLFLINNLLLSFVVALVCSYLVSPFVSQLESAGLSRLTSILLVYILFCSLLVLGIWAVSPFLVDQFQSFKDSLPHYVDGVVSLSERLNNVVNSTGGGLFHMDLSDEVRTLLTTQSTNLVKGLPSFLSSSASVLILSPLLGFFILKDGQQLSREILRFVPNNIFELVLSLQSQISDQIAHFIRARLLESAIVGIVVLVCLWIVGFPFPILLAAFAALANLIPYIGPIVGAAPGLLVAAVNSGIGLKFLIVGIVYILAQLIDIFFIIPLVVARVVNLHPITVILVVILGAEMMGILGMIISIPVAAALKVTFTNIYRHLTDYAV
jgi:putative permease